MINKITKKQARKFLTLKQGLHGDHLFSGKEGVFDFIEQAGCIQYDPIDVCGKNHELVLQSRIAGFDKKMLYELLYEERRLFDWLDKCMSICLVDDWSYFEHHRIRAKEFSRSKSDVDEVAKDIIDYIDKNGAVCSSDLDYKGKVDWSWGATSLSRAALDTLYYRGDLIISHKRNTRKFYDLSSKHIDEKVLKADNPNKTIDEIYKWNVLRRIGSVGMLHNNASYAFIGIRGLKSKERNKAYGDLLKEGLLKKIEVEGAKLPFYYKTEDEEILQRAIEDNTQHDRMEFIAPLDNMLWDRKIIEELFDFSYKWEIYTPFKDRKYGYYVLPILFDDGFIGRIEIKRNRKVGEIELLNIWWEDKRYDNSEIENKAMETLRRFNSVIY